jgi:hypothetical protein
MSPGKINVQFRPEPAETLVTQCSHKENSPLMRKVVTIAAILGIALAGVGISGPASASTTTTTLGTLSATDVRATADDCFQATVAFAPSTGYANGWTAKADVTAQDGAYAGGAYLSDADATDTVLMCVGIDKPGTYTVAADFTGYDASWQPVSGSVVTTFAFVVPAKAGTRITLTLKRTTATKNIYTATLYRNGHRWADHRLDVQARVGGSWITAHHTRTHADGSVTVTAQKGHRFLARVHSEGNFTARTANSRTFRAGR